MTARVLVVTVSDTRSAGDDRAGDAIAEALSAFEVVGREWVRDERALIAGLVRDAVARDRADVVVLTGGTGLGPRDCTVEALEPLFEKVLAGFGETFRRLSWDEVGARAVLSNAVAGTVGRALVCALPGSPKAARLGAEALIAPILPHVVDLLAGRTAHGAEEPSR